MRRLDAQRGAALVTALLFSVILLTVVTVGTTMTMGAQKDIEALFLKEGQAENIAQAGLQEAIGWFKLKSASEPVSADTVLSTDPECEYHAPFDPKYNSDPKLRETDDASVGIVRDLLIDSRKKIWGRYIVKKQPCSPAYTEADYDSLALHDITDLKGKGNKGEGVVWEITSQGIVYRRNDNSKDADGVFLKGPDEAPNQILGDAHASVEINRLNVKIPQAPITVMGTSQNLFNDNCDVFGDTEIGIVHPNSSFSKNQWPSFGVIGTTFQNSRQRQASVGLITDPINDEEVFAVSSVELKGLADNVYSNMGDLRATYFDQQKQQIQLPLSITYLDGDFQFTVDDPMVGSGVLYVDGDLTIDDGAGVVFSGFVYVTGRLTIRRDSSLAGALMVGRMDCRPGNGGKAIIEYNETILNNVRKKLALYRPNGLSLKVKNNR